MRILSLSPDVWISSAALIEEGMIIAAAAEERFNRKKMSQVFPERAMEFCLQEADITVKDLDCIVIPWNPGIHIQSGSLRYSSAMRWRGEYLYSVPSYLLNKFSFGNVDCIEQRLFCDQKNMPLYYISHHMAHAGNAFFQSPFEEAAILTVDGKGEHETCMMGTGSGTNIRKMKSVTMPHSLGLFYGSITQYLGFMPDSDEWKVMALAAYGQEDTEYYERIKSLIRLLDDGTFELDLTYFDYYLFDKQATMYSSQMINLLGRPRKRKEPIEETHIQIAAALQRVFEEAATHLLVHLRKQTNTAKVVLAGGGFMNSVFNGKIVGKGIFDDVFISSCPDDSGTSVGAALYLYHTILGNTDRKLQRHNFWGPEYSDSEIRNILEKYKVFRMYHQDIEKVAAKLIAEGKLVGWFQGKMEFGQRALGNRSILANPCMAEMKDIVNKAVKYREDFRPFAPAILEEHTEEYFDVAEGTRVPYMEKVFPIKNDKRKKIPAVVHVDGSGRLQTVSRSTNAKFYNVINHFFEITGIPIVLNTSFNLNGEPIVCTPTDAIRTFFSCGLDCLAIGNYLVEKAAAK